MAGKPGRSGGSRPGAGRKPKTAPEVPPVVDSEAPSPLAVLEAMMNNPEVPITQRIKAAAAAAPYRHVKKGEGGKKDERQEQAKKAGAGKFAAAAPPRLVVSNGR